MYTIKDKIKQIISIFSVMALSTSLAKPLHHPLVQIAAAKKAKNPGAEIYQGYCANCHNQKPLIPVGAPRIGIQKDWQLRGKKGLKKLLTNLNNGMSMMPPRGGCFECSDELLRQATLYMLPKTLQKKFKTSTSKK